MSFRRADDVLFERFEDRAVLLDPAGKELFTLNAVGTLVWQALDEVGDPSSLADRLLPELQGVTGEELRRDVQAFLTELKDLGLVVEDATG
jgi:Coenzyme PQQ synthesis protein D (PqqD)